MFIPGTPVRVQHARTNVQDPNNPAGAANPQAPNNPAGTANPKLRIILQAQPLSQPQTILLAQRIPKL